AGKLQAFLNGSAEATINIGPAALLSWTSMGPAGVKGTFGEKTSGKLQTFAVSPSAPNVFYAGGGLGPGNQGPLSHAGAFRSGDGGQTWAAVNTGLSDPLVNTIWLDPSDANIALSGTEFTGIFRTTDGGAHWSLRGAYPGAS